jgi:glycosyltransferase involved in cell wall biosynthesis
MYMPKVLHVFKIYYPEIFGGVQRAIHDIADGTVDNGYVSKVFALSTQPHPEPFQVSCHQAVTVNQQFYVASTGLSLAAFVPFRRCAAEADIIHYHFPWPFMDVLHLASRIKKPSLVTYHSDIVKQNLLLQLYKPLMHRFLSDVDQIVATSPNYLETSPVLQRFREKTTVIPLGIPDKEFVAKPHIVQKWRSQVGEGFFLFLGALRYYKGLTTLLEAARQAGLPVVIAGTGDQEETLKALAPDNVIFTGHYSDDDRAALLYLARGFVFPSHERSEAFGISLLEAARASVPMICCEIGTGTTYVNQDGVTGLVVLPNDSASLTSAMQRLNAEPDIAAQFGRAARQRFENLFTMRQMAASYADQYNTLLAGRR